MTFNKWTFPLAVLWSIAGEATDEEIFDAVMDLFDLISQGKWASQFKLRLLRIQVYFLFCFHFSRPLQVRSAPLDFDAVAGKTMLWRQRIKFTDLAAFFAKEALCRLWCNPWICCSLFLSESNPKPCRWEAAWSCTKLTGSGWQHWDSQRTAFASASRGIHQWH